MNKDLKFEYGFISANGMIKKVYHLHEIPNIKEKCDLWNNFPIAYVRPSTGVKDRNGVEIFEGDIVFVGIIKTVVKFKIGTFVLEMPESGRLYTFFDFDSRIGLEKIGNIYEMPELL